MQKRFTDRGVEPVVFRAGKRRKPDTPKTVEEVQFPNLPKGKHRKGGRGAAY